MSSKIQLWNVKNGQLTKLSEGSFSESHKEKDLEKWVGQDPSLLGKDLTVIGTQVYIPNAGPLDLLAIDDDGRLVVVEFKRHATTREAIAQILDYASALRLMNPEQLANLSNIDADKLTEVIDFDPAMILVAADADEKAERIVDYLASKAQLAIEVVTFTYVPLGNGEEILARSILTPDMPSVTQPVVKQMVLPELLHIASERKVAPLLEIFLQVESMSWYREVLDRNGGTLRYWIAVPSGKSKVIFGVNVGGKKLGSPQACLDLWFNPETAAEYSGETSETVWDELEKFLPVKKTSAKLYVRVADEQTASKLYEVLTKWDAANRKLATEGEPNRPGPIDQPESNR